MHEVRTLQQIIQRLGRARYRAVVGVCEKVVPAKSRRLIDDENVRASHRAEVKPSPGFDVKSKSL